MRISKQEEAMYLEKYTPLIMKTVNDRARKFSSYIVDRLREDLQQEAMVSFIEYIRSDRCQSEEDILMKAGDYIRYKLYAYIAYNQPLAIPADYLTSVQQYDFVELDEEVSNTIFSRNFENIALINVVTDMMQLNHRHYAKFLMEGFMGNSYNEYYNIPETTTAYWKRHIKNHFARNGYRPSGFTDLETGRRNKNQTSSSLPS